MTAPGGVVRPTPGWQTHPTRILRIVAWSFLFWTAIGVFFAAQLHFAGLTWRVALEWSLPRWYTWGLVTPAIFHLDRRLIESLALGWRIALHVPLAIAWTCFAIVLRLVVRPLRGAELPADVGTFFLERLGPDLTIYTLIACVSLVTAYTGRLKARERQARERVSELERRLVEAQLQALRDQLQPHFLFNALNTISAFTETDPPAARRLMAQLGDLLRASLAHTERALVTLGEELTFLDDYLAIESARFEGRITVSVAADDDTLSLAVPGFLLQPLVENAIRHGVSARASGGRVEVAARKQQDRLVITVQDDGLGLGPGWTFERDAGVGLRNVAARLEHLYDRRADLVVAPAAGGGVLVRIALPLGTIDATDARHPNTNG